MGALNQDTLGAIRELQSPENPHVLAELVQLFQDSLAARLERIDTAVGRADGAAIEAEAHALKSSSASLGADAMSRLCGELEARGTARELAGTPELARRLREEAARVRGEFDALPEMAAWRVRKKAA